MKIAYTAALPVLLLASACHMRSEPVQVDCKHLVSGQLGMRPEAKNAVLRGFVEWQIFCEDQGMWGLVQDKDIDWSKRMLIAVSLGSRPSGGYGVEIDRVESQGSHWVVHARETRPAPGSMQPAMLTTPFDCVSTPRFDGKVDFSIE